MKILSSLVVSTLLAMASGECFSQCSFSFGSTGYKVDGNIVRFHHSTDVIGDGDEIDRVVKGANIRSFYPFFYHGKGADCGTAYAKDDKHVFYLGKIIPGADPKTFEFINKIYDKDKHAIYYYGKIITNRVQEFSVLTEQYASDGKNYFYNDKIMDGDGFEILQENQDYARTKTKIYHYGIEVAGADPGSFSPVKVIAQGRLATDKDHVFLEDKIVPEADPSSFTQLAERSVFKDKLAIYIWYKELPGISPISARSSEYGRYLINDEGVYRIHQSDVTHDGNVSLLAGHDPATFHELMGLWTRDKNSVYYDDKSFPDADLETFHALDYYVGEDKNYRYDHEKKICKFHEEDATSIPVCTQWSRR